MPATTLKFHRFLSLNAQTNQLSRVAVCLPDEFVLDSEQKQVDFARQTVHYSVAILFCFSKKLYSLQQQ